MAGLIKKWMIVVSIIIGLVALYVIFSNIPINNVLRIISMAPLYAVLGYILVQIIIQFVIAYRWKLVLHSQGYTNLSLWRLNNYRLVGYAISFITPAAKMGGEPARAGLLSKKENIPFDKALSSVVIDKTIDLSASGTFFIIGTFILLLNFALSNEFKQMIIGVSVLFFVLIIMFYIRMFKGKNFFHRIFIFLRLNKFAKLESVGKKLKDFEDLIIKFYKQDTKYFIYTLLVALLTWVIMFLEYKFIGLMLGVNFDLLQIFLIVSFVGAAYLIPVPMALGVLEAGQISVFSIIGVSSTVGVALSLIVRVKDIILSLIGLLMLAFYGLKVKTVIKENKFLDEELSNLKRMNKQ